MTQTSKKGMWLRPEETEKSGGLGWIPQTVAALLALMALVLPVAELTGFDRLYSPAVMLTAGGCICAVHGVLQAIRRQGWFYPGTLVLSLTLVLIFRQQILDGVCLFWNRMGDTWTASTGWVLPELAAQCGAEQASACLFIFSVVTGLVCGIVCCAMASGCAAIGAVVLPVLLLCGMLVFRQDISPENLLFVLATAAFLLLYSGWNKKKTAVPLLISWAAFSVAAALLVSLAAIPGIQSGLLACREQLRRAVHERKYETKYSTLPEGDFSDFSNAETEAQPALVVTMDNPEVMYLRGFTGAAFEGDSWKPLDPGILADNEHLLYWLNRNAFNPAAQFEASIFHAEVHRNVITVQNIGACSGYRYVPFSLCSGDILQPEYLDSDNLPSEGDRIIVYSTVSGGAEMIPQVLEYLKTSNDEAVMDYRKAESAYRDFIRAHYLQIPEDMSQALVELWNAAAAAYGGVDQLTHDQALACAQRILDQCFGEDRTPAETELPLSAAAGTSFQYATVAAMTFRYFGIPARYAEGYVITEEMAANAEPGTSISADSSCAGGWVEIYHDGIGWIPADLTPGIGDALPDGTQNKTENQQNTEPEEGEELEEKPDNQPLENPDGGTLVTVTQAIRWGFLIAALTLMILLLALIARRRILLSRRERKFRAENRSDAVAWIFAHTALLLEQLGFDRGNGSMQTLYEPVRMRYGERYAGMLRDTADLNSRAMFSSHELTEAQRETALVFCSETLQILKAEAKWYRLLWLQWVRCLY